MELLVNGTRKCLAKGPERQPGDLTDGRERVDDRGLEDLCEKLCAKLGEESRRAVERKREKDIGHDDAVVLVLVDYSGRKVIGHAYRGDRHGGRLQKFGRTGDDDLTSLLAQLEGGCSQLFLHNTIHRAA